jgi:protein-disulfide isomerase
MARIRSRRDEAAAQERRQARDRKKRLLWIAGFAAMAAVAALIVAGALLRDSSEVRTVSAAQREGRVLGANSAPVVITAWVDFQCPVCKVAHETTLATIIEEYVDTGKAQLHFRYYAFLGEESKRAAQAAEAAAEQGMFWEYHDALFTNQGAENRGNFSDARLKQIASDVGLDRELFDAALDSKKYESVVEAELREGAERGVTGTPTFFITGEQVRDWRDVNAFRAEIEARLPASQ